MIVDIFSSFDRAIYTSILGGRWIWWIFEIFILNLFFLNYWCSLNRFNWVVLLSLFTLFQEVGRRRGRYLSGFLNIMVSLFFFLLVINFLGLVPYVFRLSRQGSLTFVIGLPLWFSLILSNLFWSWFMIIAHYLPLGAPAVLNPFLVIIEFISDFVRPITLSARLAANMSAGHIVLGLVGVYFCKNIFILGLVFFILLFFQIVYFFFEVGVCIIQAYIYRLLPPLYANDHRL